MDRLRALGGITDNDMIRLWISRGTSIPIRQQLSAQFVLGILSRRLVPGQRLPSVRELARRLNLHSNTISEVYQDLAERGWVDSRRGSGVFVRDKGISEDSTSLDAFIRACIEEGLTRGFSIDALRSSFASLAQESQELTFLVIDPDPELARIMAAEISEATGLPIPSAGCDEVPLPVTPVTWVLVNEGVASRVSQLLQHASLRTIHLNSMQDVLIGHRRPTSPILIAVTSRSESVLHWAWTLLSALGFPRDSVLLRNSGKLGWQDGLTSCDIVAADVVTGSELPKFLSPAIFRILSDQSVSEIRGLAKAQRNR